MSGETKLLNGLLETEDAAILKNSNFRRCLSDNLMKMVLEHRSTSAESGKLLSGGHLAIERWYNYTWLDVFVQNLFNTQVSLKVLINIFALQFRLN